MERELSEITRGFAKIKGHDQQILEDTNDVMESNEPSDSTHWSSNEDTLEDAVDAIEDDSVQDEVWPDEVLQDALEYVVDTADEDTLMQDLSGLVFFTKESGDVEKGY
jgi:hypothetical protein